MCRQWEPQLIAGSFGNSGRIDSSASTERARGWKAWPHKARERSGWLWPPHTRLQAPQRGPKVSSPSALPFCSSAGLNFFLSLCLLNVSSLLINSTFSTRNPEEGSGWPPNYHHLSLHRALGARPHRRSQAHLQTDTFCAGTGHVTWTLPTLLELLPEGPFSSVGQFFSHTVWDWKVSHNDCHEHLFPPKHPCLVPHVLIWHKNDCSLILWLVLWRAYSGGLDKIFSLLTKEHHYRKRMPMAF